jgi:tRNA C32,U32 (ribose-2'-O)-methylase TrmJ
MNPLAALASSETLVSSEAGSEKIASKHLNDIPATADQVDGMYQHLFEMLEDVEFTGSSNPEIVKRRLKGLFNRAHLTRREVSILRGIYSAAQGRKSARK